MNSDQEREILEAWGWVYDHVKRQWEAPDGFVVTIDDLMIATDQMGPFVETRLREVAREHGARKLS